MNTVANCEKTYTVKQLQALLAERGLPTSGVKAVLCKRLVDYEKKYKKSSTTTTKKVTKKPVLKELTAEPTTLHSQSPSTESRHHSRNFWLKIW